MKHALAYARAGWRVIPIVPGEKRPAIPDWPNAASTDPNVIAAWWHDDPARNVGLVTGAASGFFVLDVDLATGGAESLAALEATHGPLPETCEAITGSGGRHLLFTYPGFPVSNSAGRLGPGLDIRGDGGQIVVAPSRTAKGPYRWRRFCAPVPAPAWLLDLLRTRVAVAAPVERPPLPPATPEVLDAARRALQRHGPAVEGKGGDDHTFRACAIVTHDFGLTDVEAWPVLLEWNAACLPPWDEEALRTKLRGGAKYGTAPYGFRRPGNTLSAVRAILATINGADSIPAILHQVNDLLSDGVDAPTLAAVAKACVEATGYKQRELGLPRAVDVERKNAQAARRRQLEAGSGELIDPDAPLRTAHQFLVSTADAEGRAEIVRWQDDFYRACGTHYEVIGGEAINARLYPWLETKRDVDSNAPIKPDRGSVEGLVHALEAAAHLDAREAPAWIDEDPADPSPLEVVAFRNGLLHVPTSDLQPPTRRFFNHNALTFDYDPLAADPREWLGFLAQLWGGDAESVETLQEIFGLALTGDTSFQKLFLLIGPKRSGKGTIGRVLREVVGQANTCAPTLTGLGSHFGLESLIGKQIAIISDARLGGRADLGAVTENLLRVSGEDTISVPRKNRTDFTAKLRARFLIISNEVPALVDSSGALAGRFVVLRLVRSFFGQEDRGLTTRLLGELPGVVLWALEGLTRLLDRGHFRQPTSAGDLVHQLEALGSPVKAFVEDRCVVDDDGKVDCRQMFEAYLDWSAIQGREHPGTAQVFGRNLSAAFPEIAVVGAYPARAYVGIRLAG